MNWIKKFLTRLLLILFGFTVSILIAEGFLRLSGKKPLAQNLPRWYFTNTDYGYDITKNFWPPEIFFVERLNFKIWSNELGCFDNPSTQNSEILLIGDSFTWGYAPFEDEWGSFLEKYIKTGILKCGVAGYGTKLSLLKAKNIIPSFPSLKLIIYGYFFNDLDDDFLFPHFTVVGGHLTNKVIIENFNDGTKTIFTEENIKQKLENYSKYGIDYKPKNKFIQQIKHWLHQHSTLYNLTKDSLKKILTTIVDKAFLKKTGVLIVNEEFDRSYPFLIFGKTKYSWINNALYDHLKNLKEFKTLPTNVLITLIPTKEQVYPQLLNCKEYRAIINSSMISLVKTDEDLTEPQKIVRSFLEKESIPYIDFLPLFRFYADHGQKCFLDNKKDLYWSIDGHWNIKGNHLAGLLLGRFLIKEGLIEVQNKDEILYKIENNLKTEFGKLPPDDLWQLAIYIPKK